MKGITKATKSDDIVKKWILIDANGHKIGQISGIAAKLLMGKDKTNFVSNLNCGDNVVIINAAHVKVGTNAGANKMFYRYSGYPGGLRSLSLDEFMKKNPSKVIEHSIKGMLPKNKVGKEMVSHLFVYNEDSHPHAAQKPEILNIEIKENGRNN